MLCCGVEIEVLVSGMVIIMSVVSMHVGEDIGGLVFEVFWIET